MSTVGGCTRVIWSNLVDGATHTRGRTSTHTLFSRNSCLSDFADDSRLDYGAGVRTCT